MFRPQNLVAAFLSAALLCTTGIALADKGGNHDKHGGSSSQGPATPGQSSSGESKGGAHGAPGGVGKPQSAPGPFDRSMSHNRTMGDGSRGSEFEGDVDASFRGGSNAKAGVNIKLATGGTRTFAISDAALSALKALQVRSGKRTLIFFTTNGNDITAVSAIGEKMNMRVVARSGETFTLQSADGQSRLITLDAKTAARLHVKVGADLQLIAMSAVSGKVVALDLVKSHDFDKFARGMKTDVDVDVAKTDIDRAKVDIDVAKAKKTKKADIDVVSADIDAVKTDIDVSKGKKSKKLDIDVAKLDNDEHNLEAANGCGHTSSRNGNPAFANQMAKDAANDASGHNPPGLPHECVNPAGHTRGFCKSSASASICGGSSGSGGETETASAGANGSEKHRASNGEESKVASNISKPCAPGSSKSRSGNPAFANQMAKDEANDISGHNPPGLPHECVNPAGHTRGFCKSKESNSAALCGGSMGGGNGISPSELHGGIARGAAPGSNPAPAPGAATAPVNGGTAATRGFTPSANGGLRGPGAPVGFIPAGGGQFANGATRGPGAAGAPTHVLGASTGPTGGRRIAALPTRVLPVAIQPVGKRRCVWYKTGVLGASTGPYRIIGTSAVGGKPVLHKKCR